MTLEVPPWPNIRPRDHHGHHDICPGYKVDVLGFPLARVLRGIHPNEDVPDVWTPLLTAEQRQEALLPLGQDLGSAGVDGDWGRRSDSALRRFQREQGMLEDGMWTVFTSYRVYDKLPAPNRRAIFRL